MLEAIESFIPSKLTKTIFTREADSGCPRHGLVHCMCGFRKFCQRWTNSDNAEGREDPNTKYHNKRAIIGPPAKCYPYLDLVTAGTANTNFRAVDSSLQNATSGQNCVI